MTQKNSRGMSMITNCVNCGAPIKSNEKMCPYCKTPYDVSGFTAEIGESFGELKIGGRTCKVCLGNVEHNQVLEAPHRAEDGSLCHGHTKTLRTFTLIEM